MAAEYDSGLSQSTTIQVLEHLLETCIVKQDQSTLQVFGTEKSILFVSQDEIPFSYSKNNAELLMSLFLQRLKTEIDGIKFCIVVYNRTLNCPQFLSVDPKAWQVISTATQKALASVVLSILIEASCSQKEDNIFSTYSQGSHGDINTFLSSISGWCDDGMSFPFPLLRATLEASYTTVEGKKSIVAVLKSAMKNIEVIKRPDEILMQGNKTFDALQIILAEVSVQRIVAEELLEEVIQNSSNLGHYFEKKGLFSCLLSQSTFIQKINPGLLKSTWYQCFFDLRGFPTVFQGDVQPLHMIIQDGIHKSIRLLHSTFLALLKCSPSAKNNVLAWFAAVVSLNETRRGPKFEIQKGNSDIASDGFLINFCLLLLHFCQPFFSYDPAAPKLPLIVADYPTSEFCRLYFNIEPCFAHGVINKSSVLSCKQFQCSEGNFKFVTEIFFITLRALHIGLQPVADTFLSTLNNLAKEIERKGGQDKLLSDLNGLYLISGSCSLLDPLLVQLCSHFYVTNAVWLTMLLQSCEKQNLRQDEIHFNQRKLFSKIPEHAVKDMVKWFLFVLRTQAKLLQDIQLTPFVDCCISLLERPDLLPGPIAQSQIISVLLVCIGEDKNSQRLLSTETWGNIRGELTAMVQGSPAFQSRLGPALLHTFSAVGVVEGLDVDKEDFDKYAARYDITQLLLHLWHQTNCRESIVQQSGTEKFSSFLGAIFDTLLYQLNDSLLRITNVHRLEQEKDNTAVWSTLTVEEVNTKERFLMGEKRAVKALLNMGMKLLSLLEKVTEVESVSQHLCVPPLSGRVAASFMGFLDMLCGARQSELKVRDSEQMNFNPRAIVSQLATVIAHLWQIEKRNLKDDGFMNSLAKHPDYNHSVINKVINILEKYQLCGEDVISGYKTFTNELSKAASENPMAQASLVIDLFNSNSLKLGTVAEWQTEVESIVIDKECLREIYVASLGDIIYDTTVLQGVHCLQNMITSASLDPRSPRLLAILRDVKQLQESLSLHPDSSIFVRQDEDRMDLVRVMITGPVDTPYNFGCFVFDVYYPANYPNDPPLVLLTTTGNGTIRFNPNLYADGKVCLSLLGTWHGGDSSEKWNPSQSNLLQVLISIQGLILITQPIYNEPGYEALQGTPEGKKRSDQYNAYVQISTIRYAILEQLRNPPAGLEDAIKIHFMLLKDVVLCQCSHWLRQTVSSDHEQKLRKAINELRIEFDKI